MTDKLLALTHLVILAIIYSPSWRKTILLLFTISNLTNSIYLLWNGFSIIVGLVANQYDESIEEHELKVSPLDF